MDLAASASDYLHPSVLLGIKCAQKLEERTTAIFNWQETDPVSWLETLDLRTDALDHTGSFMTQDDRLRRTRERAIEHHHV